MKKLTVTLIILLIVTGCTIQTDTDNLSEEEFNNSGKAKAILDETDLWQYHENLLAGFSLKYPANVSMEENTAPITLHISAEEIDKIEEPGYGKEEALKNKTSLKEGKYPKEGAHWAIEASKKVRTLKNLNAQEFMVLGRFEICDTVFERKLIFYNNNKQITITVSANKEQIKNSMPDYFTVNQSNCGEDKIWILEKMEDFLSTLVEEKGSEITQEWYSAFDKIVETITLTEETSQITAEEIAQKLMQEENADNYEIQYQNQEIVSISLTTNLNGAYPSMLTTQHVISKNTGNPITINQIIKAEKQNELVKICNAKLQKNIQTAIIKAEEMKWDVSQEQFKKNCTEETLNSFLIKENGIEFFYNFEFPHAIKIAEPANAVFISNGELKDFDD